MAEHVEDEVVAPGTNNNRSGRRVITETVDGATGASRQTGDDDDDVHVEGGSQRRFGAVGEEILAKMDADEKERRAAARAAEVEDEEEVDTDDVGLLEGAEAAKPAEKPAVAAAPAAKPAAPAAPPVDEWKTKYDSVERANRQLLADLEAERARPRETISERHAALADAEETYVNEGAGPAFRKFLAVVLGAAHDSKEVEAELAGAYVDLTAADLGVPLTDAQQARRDAARARLALARDKKERKASEAPKPVADPAGGDIEKVSAFIGNRLTTKNAEGKALGDDFPLLTRFAEKLDGLSPDKLIARVLKQYSATGVIDVASYGNRDDDLIRDVAKMIENHYTSLADEFSAAKPKMDTAPSGDKKPTDAVKTSEEQRQSTAARITNANAGTAPASPPTKKKTEKKLPLKGSARKDALLSKYIPD